MNLISRFQHQFDTRIIFGGTLINIGGETLECKIEQVNDKYIALVNGKEVCSFYQYHIDPVGYLVPADMFQIRAASLSGADVTLIIPLLWKRPSEDDDGEDDWCMY